MKDLYIIGAGGFGREVAWVAERVNQVNPTWTIKGFIDDNESLWGTIQGAYPVLGGIDYLLTQDNAYTICAIGSSKTRKKIISRVTNGKIKFATLIDPSVLIASRAKIGEGTVICANSIIAVDSTIGNHVIINLTCTIGHDDIIKDFVTINPGVNVSGFVTLEECVEMGTGSKVIQGLTISPNCIVGASAAVVKNIEETGTYVGIPAKKIK